MAKLQKITRANQSEVYSVNLPKSTIEEAKWIKGDNIDVIISKTTSDEIIIILKREDNGNN